MEPGQSRLRGGDAGRRDDSLARMAAGGGGFGVITPVVRARLQRSVAYVPPFAIGVGFLFGCRVQSSVSGWEETGALEVPGALRMALFDER